MKGKSPVIKRVGFLLFENFTAMDIVGPLEAFSSVQEVSDCRYQILMIGLDKGGVRAESNMAMVADYTIHEITDLDTLIIPGGMGARDPIIQRQLVPWLVTQKTQIRRIVSICTGAFLVASAGLLDGMRATTHWAFTELFRTSFKKVKLLEDSLYVDNGSIATSAGIAAGIDLSLKLIENDYGSEIASKVARFMVVHYRRAGDQAQYSQPLQYQDKANSKFSALTGWILNNLSSDLSIESLANQVTMSSRNFSRKFRQQMNESPARYVQRMRLDYARQLLAENDWPIGRVGDACGYDNTDVFRRAFERRFSVSPKEYRNRFSQNKPALTK